MAETVKIYYPNTIEDNPIYNTVDETGKSSDSNDIAGVYEPQSTPGVQIPTYTVASEVISLSLDTLNKKILGSYGFSETGAIQIGKYVNAVTGDIRISPTGILGRDKTGATTFAIDATTGDATFKGTVLAGSIIAASITVDASTTFAAGYDPTTKVASVGGNYTSTATAAAAKVKLLPDANTGIIAYASDGTTVVFKVEVGGANVGDVTLGNYAGGYGVLWDQSAGKLYIKGDLQAGSMSADRITSGTLDVDRIPTITADKISVSTLSAIDSDLGTITAGTIHADVVTVDKLNASNLVTGVVYAGGTGHPTEIQIYRNGSNGYLTWEGGNKIWTDGSEYMGFSADGERFYFYTGATLYALFQRGSQAGFYAGISCDGSFNVTSGNNARFAGKIYCYNDNSDQYIDGSDNDLKLHAGDNIEFYHNGGIVAIVDDNFWTAGDLIAGGSKPFIVPHPDGSKRFLRYTAQESPDVSLRLRGEGFIDITGECVLVPPKHFTLITEPEGLITINLTHMDANQDLYVFHMDKNKEFTIKGTPNTRFMYEIVAIRKGYLDYAVELDDKDPAVSKLTQLVEKNALAKKDQLEGAAKYKEEMASLKGILDAKNRKETDHK